ncbi:hypothetical protein OXYTRIMIC_766 [Oxytricha trifallax]|uniref:Uncharacterized protein n=1 Tax=Oxytricha trifallax TaxID=1172189 RepID=A0A073HZP5_9SPIT|nr:hypothetical protein OXYTRIMIC_766 [Oxytricha trifallax]
MRGRISRSMGASKQKYFPIAKLPKQRIIHKMKLIQIEKLDNLEQLLTLVDNSNSAKCFWRRYQTSKRIMKILRVLMTSNNCLGRVHSESCHKTSKNETR